MTEARGTYKTKKRKSTWGGPRANSGGLRVPGPGKSLGRPKKFGSAMAYKGIRVPPSWIPLLLAHGDGDFAEGVRRIIGASGVVDGVE